MPESAAGEYGAFPTTRWTVVARSRAVDPDVRRAALEQLLARYFPALKAHAIKKKGLAPDEADDLVQGFVASKVLEQRLIAQAEQRRGRFRTFLVTSLNNYFVSELRRGKAQKRAPRRMRNIEEHPRRASLRDDPAAVFDVAWARQILARACEKMRIECEEGHRRDVWGIFESRVLAPALNQTPPPHYELLVSQFNLPSPTHASNLLVTGKRMFARILRRIVSEYAEDEEIEEEIADLRRILAGE